jgi:hypothetical protein
VCLALDDVYPCRYSWSSLHDDDSYYDDDVVTFSDHGLWNDQPRQPPPSAPPQREAAVSRDLGY